MTEEGPTRTASTGAAGAHTTGITALDILMFAAEMAVYAAVGTAAWRAMSSTAASVVAAAAAVLVMALWWGLLHSPKALVRLPRAVDLAGRACWFVVGILAAWAATR